tara:strand:+ start:136 stop:306 length:171 start_codon:yes stop_codon:yes gene_type:complete
VELEVIELQDMVQAHYKEALYFYRQDVLQLQLVVVELEVVLQVKQVVQKEVIQFLV